MPERSTAWLHWLVAGAVCLVPLSVIGIQFSWTVAALIGAAVVVAGSTSFLVALLKPPPAPVKGHSRNDLVKVIDRYLTETISRRKQRPWLLVSLISYATAYVTFTLFIDPLPAPDTYWFCGLCCVAALVTMGVAGVLAEEHSPREGEREMLEVLVAYEPLNVAAHRALLSKARDARATSEDLVDFVTSEEQEELLECRKQVTASLLQRGPVRPAPGVSLKGAHVAKLVAGLGIAGAAIVAVPVVGKYLLPSHDPDPRPLGNIYEFSAGSTVVDSKQPRITVTIPACRAAEIRCAPAVEVLNSYDAQVTLLWASKAEESSTPLVGFTVLEPKTTTRILLQKMSQNERLSFEFADVHTAGDRIGANSDERHFRAGGWSEWFRPNAQLRVQARVNCMEAQSGSAGQGMSRQWYVQWRQPPRAVAAEFDWQARPEKGVSGHGRRVVDEEMTEPQPLNLACGHDAGSTTLFVRITDVHPKPAGHVFPW